MDKLSKVVVLLFPCFMLIIITDLFATTSHAAQQQDCSTYFANNIYTSCNTLPVLNSFIHWNYHPSNHTLDIAYTHTRITASNWIAWALNLGTTTQMDGAQSLVALHNSTTGVVHAYTSPISGHHTTLQQAPLSFRVPRLTAQFVSNDQMMIIFATIILPQGRTRFTQVWQHGDVSAGGTILPHLTSGDNMRSFGTIDFAATTGTGRGAAATQGSIRRRRNIHGVLNVVSWGILLPVGAMIARYLKVLMNPANNEAWLYVHIVCQSSAYVVGVAGWGIGLRLGSESAGVERTSHRNIGIILFAMGTVQVFALLIRPKPEHKYRFYWNMYHQLAGYSVIVLSIINIFKGFDILNPAETKWRRAYMGVVIFMGANAFLLEALTWFKRKKQQRDLDKYPPPHI